MSAAGLRGGVADGAGALDEDAEELYEEAPCGYLSTLPDGTILRANRTFLRWVGHDAGELVRRRRFSDLLPTGAKIYYETHYAPLLEMQGAVREIAFELVRRDGSRLPVLVSAVVKRDPAGRPQLVRVTVFDASDRRRYERELLQARSEAEARAAAANALERVAEGVVLLDADGRIRLLNPAAERILGASVEELRGLPLTAAAPGWAAVAARIPVAGRGDAPAQPVVVPLELSAGTRWLAASGASAEEGAVYTLRDVTDERRLEELRDDIVAIVSHELRTPLAGVYGAAQTLSSLGDRLGEEQRRQLVEMIGEQSGRLTRIVDEILLARRLDTGDVEVARRTFDVGAAVERAVAELRAAAELRLVEVEAAGRLEAEGDPELFGQVLGNLLENAVTYSPPESPVRVVVERGHGSVRVTVADAGPGIPPGCEERIFERFFRLDPDQTTGAAGLGLGLYVARELARRMGGRVGLLPSSKGSLFFVELPLRPPA